MEYNQTSNADDKGVRIFIELGTHLQLDIEGTNISLTSEMIGMEVGKYLIIKVYQMNNDQREELRNNTITAKYLHKNSVLGFKSNIISIISEPENIIFLKYPKNIKNFNVRTNERAPCFLPIQLEIEYNVVEGAIIDINTSGCCCLIKHFKILNEQALEKVTIHLQNSKLEREYSLLGNVRSIRKKKDELNIGIMFIKIDSNTQKAIQAIVPTLKFGNEVNVS